MSCSQSDERALRGSIGLGVIAVGLAACAPVEPVVDTSAPPVPEPMVMAEPPPPPPPIFRVRSGSPSVLERFPRGSVIDEDTEICLEDGEQINVIGNNGQTVSYVGPGCMTRTAPASSENEGGFIFGHRENGDAAEMSAR